MALSNMTGFARSHGASGPYAFEWELKSVNAKGFDLRVRLPPGWDELEALTKKRAGEVLSRGTVYANLNVKRTNAVSTIRINEDVLASIVKVAGVLAGKIDAVAPSIDGLLSIKGVIEVVEPESNELEDKAAMAAAAVAFEQALTDLVEMRRRGGCDARTDFIAADETRSSVWPKRPRPRPAANPRRSRPGSPSRSRHCSIPPTASIPTGSIRKRCMIAAKADNSRRARPYHLACLANPRDDRQRRTGRTTARVPAQEFNREVNTCCSKSNDLELTNTGLEMKSVVEQFREQVQNLE